MNDRFIKAWALFASALALILFGVQIGRTPMFSPAEKHNMQSVERASGLVSTETDSISTEVGGNGDTQSVGSKVPEAVYSVPDAFVGLPTEWRTQFNGVDFNGYAILFDPFRQEIIVEQCRHPGHFDEALNRPIEAGTSFGKIVLWSRINLLSSLMANVTTRDGKPEEIKLSLTEKEGQRHLALSFGNHVMDLIPGSKNDLYQAMDRTPEMRRQQRLVFEYQQTEYLKQQQQQQQRSAVDVMNPVKDSHGN